MTRLLRRCWFRRVHFQVVGAETTLCKRTPPPLDEQRYEPPAWEKRRLCGRCFNRLEALQRDGARFLEDEGPLFNQSSQGRM